MPFTYVPKLIDFGLAIVMTVNERSKDICGTLAYCSPEIVRRETYEFKTDIWSMGVVAYAVLRGRLPFSADQKNIMKFNIVN